MTLICPFKLGDKVTIADSEKWDIEGTNGEEGYITEISNYKIVIDFPESNTCCSIPLEMAIDIIRV